MKLICKLIYNSSSSEMYELTEEGFLYNNVLYSVEDRYLKLLNLIEYTFDWEEKEFPKTSIVNGFYVYVDTNKTIKEYFFEDDLPKSFNAFIYEMKKYLGR